ncbi:DNA polymerase I [Candidatus Falkowbacteria bacterium RBG_13_39_14]|uniref:DNA polymerase I n=1 Tax=Candidatus Falkowbacteria bacterium RBG_13_39_14 TaxID=1797985 RepID=A0A1F5S145_9BACT|nr:MAG: DNA polymerase I [Candidatus Falkowbacteria bacterium RBG_13_39_14]
MQKFIIIDGNAILHRSFHALPPLTTKDGEMINAVYGFTMTLLKSIKDLNPKYIAVTFDKAAPTFRHELYEAYKGTRVKADGIEELYNQIPKLKEILKAFHIPFYEKDGFEADDLIGTIAKKIYMGNKIPPNLLLEKGGNKEERLETIIVTGDLDTLQLVNSHTKVYTLKKGLSDTVIYDEAGVKERFEGLAPEQMIDYKALRGDPSDNIPGVKGIGEKGAIKLLNEFKTLENLYEKLEVHEDFLPQKLAERLIAHKEDALMSKKLAAIDKNADFNFNFMECEWIGYDKEKIFELFQKFEFKSLLNRLPEKIYQGAKRPEKEYPEKEKKYVMVDTEEKFVELLKNLNKQTQIVIDIESTSENPVTCDLVGISFCWKEGESRYIERSKFPPAADPPLADKRGARNQILWDELKQNLENPEIKKAGHNIKYALIALAGCGINLKGANFDTMIASYLLNPGSRAHDLDELVFRELGYQMMPIEDLIGKGREQINMSMVPREKVCSYSCENSDYAFRLMKKLEARLKEYKSYKVFEEIETPLIPVLAEMEINGVKIHSAFLSILSKDFNKRIKKLEEKIYKIAGVEFNISSPVQLKEILFEKLGVSIKNIKKGKTGLSTAASELEKLRGAHPIIELIFEHRELAKLISTYVNALPKLINKKTGRVHTSFNQTITATGRLSSSNPNLQNIPIRTELGKSIRKAFVAEKGYKLISADYSQIELRIIASLAKDEKMISAFKKDLDIHAATASEIFKIPLSDVTPKMRRQAKAINFGIIYGMGPRGLADAADISFDEAQIFIDEYFALYANIKKFIDKTIQGAHRNGFVETYFGRRRYLPEIASGSPFIRAGAERMAINHPIQGTSADLIKMAMIKVNDKLRNSELAEGAVSKMQSEVKMLLQIHDELLFEARENSAEKISSVIKDEMENAAKFEAPIKVDIAIGDNWGEI